MFSQVDDKEDLIPLQVEEAFDFISFHFDEMVDFKPLQVDEAVDLIPFQVDDKEDLILLQAVEAPDLMLLQAVEKPFLMFVNPLLKKLTIPLQIALIPFNRPCMIYSPMRSNTLEGEFISSVSVQPVMKPLTNSFSFSHSVANPRNRPETISLPTSVHHI